MRRKRKPSKGAIGIFILLSLFSLSQDLVSLRYLFKNSLILILFLWIVITIISVVSISIKSRKKQYSRSEIAKEIREMTPRQFEVFCGNVFKQLGYKTKVTDYTSDGGKDVIATNGEDIIYIECKHYSMGNLVGREILQKLVGASVGGGATRAILITTSGYNNNAYNYAKTIPWLDLWNIDDLVEVVSSLDKQWYALYNLNK